jgi:hypothetical protein
MSLIYQAPAFSGGGPRPGLYLGGKADAKDRDKLDRWNVTHILNVTPPKQAGIQVNKLQAPRSDSKRGLSVQFRLLEREGEYT